MKYCTYCGAEVMEEAVVCPHCGCPLKEGKSVAEDSKPVDDGHKLGVASIIAGIFVPLAGWICGGIGLSKAKNADSKDSKTLNIIGIIVSTVSFIANMIWTAKVWQQYF